MPSQSRAQRKQGSRRNTADAKATKDAPAPQLADEDGGGKGGGGLAGSSSTSTKSKQATRYPPLLDDDTGSHVDAQQSPPATAAKRAKKAKAAKAVENALLLLTEAFDGAGGQQQPLLGRSKPAKPSQTAGAAETPSPPNDWEEGASKPASKGGSRGSPRSVRNRKKPFDLEYLGKKLKSHENSKDAKTADGAASSKRITELGTGTGTNSRHSSGRSSRSSRSRNPSDKPYKLNDKSLKEALIAGERPPSIQEDDDTQGWSSVRRKSRSSAKAKVKAYNDQNAVSWGQEVSGVQPVAGDWGQESSPAVKADVAGDWGATTTEPAAGDWGRGSPHKEPAGDWGRGSPFKEPTAGDWGRRSPQKAPAGDWGRGSPVKAVAGDWGRESPTKEPAGNWGRESPTKETAANWGRATTQKDLAGDWGRESPPLKEPPAGNWGRESPAGEKAVAGDWGRASPPPKSGAQTAGDWGQDTTKNQRKNEETADRTHSQTNWNGSLKEQAGDWGRESPPPAEKPVIQSSIVDDTADKTFATQSNWGAVAPWTSWGEEADEWTKQEEKKTSSQGQSRTSRRGKERESNRSSKSTSRAVSRDRGTGRKDARNTDEKDSEFPESYGNWGRISPSWGFTAKPANTDDWGEPINKTTSRTQDDWEKEESAITKPRFDLPTPFDDDGGAPVGVFRKHKPSDDWAEPTDKFTSRSSKGPNDWGEPAPTKSRNMGGWEETPVRSTRGRPGLTMARTFRRAEPVQQQQITEDWGQPVGDGVGSRNGAQDIWRDRPVGDWADSVNSSPDRTRAGEEWGEPAPTSFWETGASRGGRAARGGRAGRNDGGDWARPEQRQEDATRVPEKWDQDAETEYVEWGADTSVRTTTDDRNNGGYSNPSKRDRTLWRSRAGEEPSSSSLSSYLQKDWDRSAPDATDSSRQSRNFPFDTDASRSFPRRGAQDPWGDDTDDWDKNSRSKRVSSGGEKSLRGVKSLAAVDWRAGARGAGASEEVGKRKVTTYEVLKGEEGGKPVLQKREKDRPRGQKWDPSPADPIDQKGRPKIFEDYITLSEVTTGLKEGTLHKGSLRINRRNRFDAYVSLDPTPTSSITQDIYICGTRNRNRALDGDTVVVRLLDGEQLEKERAEEASRRDRKRRDDKERQARCDVRAEGEEEATEVETEVEVEESEPAENRIFGKIVYLVDRRSNGEYPGTLSWDSPNAFGRGGGRSLDQRPRLVWFQPTDKRVPLMAIPTEHAPREFMQDPTAYSTILFKASMGRWPSTSQHPFGVVTGTLGQLGEISIETEALLVDAGVTWDTFTDEVISCLPRTPWTIPKEEYAKRRDLRAETIFSIDPPTARDLDDAVSVKPVGEGKFEVGVHIADVSHFVRPGSALDKEARNRATTVYLVQKAIPMLPRLLCEELCSLNPGVERLAFSVIWIMDAQARPVGKPWFGKSVIKSCAKLSYEHAQRIIEGRRWDGLPKVELSGGVTMDRLKADILRFYEFSRMMRQRRFEDGALAINNYKLWFSIDDYGNPYNTGIYEIKEANKLIEEFMLLANMAVAQKISEVFPNTALLRNHARPAEKSMADFVQFAAKLGYVIDPETSASLQQSFENIPDANQRTVLKQLCIKPMQRAKYFCTGSVDIQQWRHFALSVPLYTHFTSPIRRYCDLVVHRMLEVICDGRNEDVYDMKEVAMIAKRCNDMKDASKAAQEASQKLYLCAYLALLSEQEAARVASMGESTQNAGAGVLTEAQVYNIGTRSLDVLVPEFGVEKRVWMEDSIELGDVVGVEDVHGEIGALRIHWNKPTADGLDDDPEGLADRLARLELAEMEREESDLAKTGKKGRVDAVKKTATMGSDTTSSDSDTRANPKKQRPRTFDRGSVLTQKIRIFDQIAVRIVPDLTKSPPDFKVFAVPPWVVLSKGSRVIAGGKVKPAFEDFSCPAASEDAE